MLKTCRQRIEIREFLHVIAFQKLWLQLWPHQAPLDRKVQPDVLLEIFMMAH